MYFALPFNKCLALQLAIKITGVAPPPPPPFKLHALIRVLTNIFLSKLSSSTPLDLDPRLCRDVMCRVWLKLVHRFFRRFVKE